MAKFADRVKVGNTTAANAGSATTLTLGSAEAGYQAVPSSLNGETIRYVIEEGNTWEIGTGTYTHSGTTLTRSVTSSSNSNNAIAVTTNSKVFIAPVADDLQFVQVYSSTSDLPSASDNHGRITHVHGEGAMYFAHSGSWIKLANANSNTVPYSSNIYTANGSSPFNSGNTVLTANYTQGKEAIYVNGVKYLSSTDYSTNTGGTTITFTSALSTNDKVELIEHGALANLSFTELTDTPSALGTAGQVAQVNSAGNAIEFADAGVANQGTLTKTFTQNETSTITLSNAVSPVPMVSVFKEIPQVGVSSKGNWDVNPTGSNYDRLDEAPTSYSGVTLTPSATGDGTFTSSNPIVAGYDVSGISNVGNYDTSIAGNQVPNNPGSYSIGDFAINPAGTKIIVAATGRMHEFTMSTAYDITSTSWTEKYDYGSYNPSTWGGYGFLEFAESGSRLYMADPSNHKIDQFTLSTAYSLGNGSSDVSHDGEVSGLNTSGTGVSLNGIYVKDSTTVFILKDDYAGTNAVIEEWVMSTAWDITTLSYNNKTKTISGQRGCDMAFSSDGLTMFITDLYGSGTMKYFSLTTAWDITTINTTGTAFTNPAATNSTPNTIRFSQSGVKLYMADGTTIYEQDTGTSAAFSSTDIGKIVEGNSGSAIITDTSGTYKSVTAFADTSAISSWQLFGTQGKADGSGIQLAQLAVAQENINTATANSLNSQSSSNLGLSNTLYRSWHMSDDGTHIAATPSNTQTLMYQMSTPFDISTIGSATSTLSRPQYASGFWMNGDGTRYVLANYGGTEAFFMYTMTTPYDFSTASANGSFSDSTIISNNPAWVELSADGSKMFYGFTDIASSGVIGILTMTTPWNLSTGSATYLNFNNTFGFTAVNESTTDWFFNSDGTRFFINSGTKGTVIKQYNLTTAYDLTTASDTNLSLTISNSSEVYHMQKADNGTKLIYAGKAAGQSTQLIGVYDLIIDDGTTTPSYNQYFPNVTNTSGQIDTAAWTDINSMTADEAVGNGTVNYAVSTDDRTIWKIAHNTSGIRSIAKNNSGTWQYNSNATYGSETWTNSTTNSELAALQQALSVSQNRMDKSQLDAVTDANHFTLGDTLDLMIAVQMASGSTVPKSDGVSINYDAATLVRQAAAGTDYEAEFPSSTSVKIKSLAAQNLKVRVI